MGIINIVENVKKIHKEYITLIKVGNFYYCYGRDSYIISYLFNYKINILKNNIYSCAFSQNAIHKVTAKLENSKINYLILDRRNNYQVDEKSNNKNLNQYTKYCTKFLVPRNGRNELVIGVSDFKILRAKENYFIDKSLFIKDIIDNQSSVAKYLNRHHGKPVILLVDEYDVPLQNAYVAGYYEETKSICI